MVGRRLRGCKKENTYMVWYWLTNLVKTHTSLMNSGLSHMFRMEDVVTKNYVIQAQSASF